MAILTKAEIGFIRNQLSVYGVTEREVCIYLEALKSGPLSVQSLAEKLGENRITVHSASSQLLKKGFLFESRKGKRRVLSAEKPSSLLRLIKIKEQELQNAKNNVGYVVDLLEKNYPSASHQPKISFHEGEDGFKRMLEMTLETRNEFLGLIDVEIFSDLLPRGYLERYFRRRAENGIHSRLLWPHVHSFGAEVLENAHALKVDVRVLNSESNWDSGFISWNNCVSLKSFGGGSITCTIIENEDISRFYRTTIFEKLWQEAQAP